MANLCRILQAAVLLAILVPTVWADEPADVRALTRSVIFDEASCLRILKEGHAVRLADRDLLMVMESGRIEGRRVFAVGGKLYDRKGGSISFKAQEAEVRFDLSRHQIYLRLQNAEVWNDESHAWFADRTFELTLP